MLGFRLDFWDYVTFGALFLVLAFIVATILWLAGLPGRIAVARKHPDAEAVKLLGWAGFLPVVPWIQAFMWAFKPTQTIDIRRFPKEEERAIDEEMVALSKKAVPIAMPDAKPPNGETNSEKEGTT
jgi:Protein of unknown function (DUF3302)